jgi:hypothetical protein
MFPVLRALTVIAVCWSAFFSACNNRKGNRMGRRKSIVREAIERLDSLMAIGTSRFQAKQAQRAARPEAGWTVSTGKIHSHTTRKVYQQQILAFINWARDLALSLVGRTRR